MPPPHHEFLQRCISLYSSCLSRTLNLNPSMSTNILPPGWMTLERPLRKKQHTMGHSRPNGRFARSSIRWVTAGPMATLKHGSRGVGIARNRNKENHSCCCTAKGGSESAEQRSLADKTKPQLADNRKTQALTQRQEPRTMVVQH